jgi:sigma-54-specific transcriptional regulator
MNNREGELRTLYRLTRLLAMGTQSSSKQALMTCRGYLITAEDLRFGERSIARVQPAPARDPLDEGLEQSLLTHAAHSYHRVEDCLIRKALELTKHNQVRAAHLLGITRNILRHRLKQFGML